MILSVIYGNWYVLRFRDFDLQDSYRIAGSLVEEGSIGSLLLLMSLSKFAYQ